MMSSNPGVAPALLSAELGVPMSKMELLEQRINGGRLESTGADATQSSMQDSAMDTDSMDMDQSQGESSLSQPTRKRKRNFTPEEDERIKEGCRRFGNQWEQVAQWAEIDRTAQQIRSRHARLVKLQKAGDNSQPALPPRKKVKPSLRPSEGGDSATKSFASPKKQATLTMMGLSPQKPPVRASSTSSLSYGAAMEGGSGVDSAALEEREQTIMKRERELAAKEKMVRQLMQEHERKQQLLVAQQRQQKQQLQQLQKQQQQLQAAPEAPAETAVDEAEEQRRAVLVELLVQQAEAEKEAKRREVVKDTMRLGSMATERRGATFAEVWREGEEHARLTMKLKGLEKEKDGMEKLRKQLAKRRAVVTKQRGDSTNDSTMTADEEIERLSLQEELLKINVTALRKEESELQAAVEKLGGERVVHIRRMKWMRDQTLSRFKDHPLLEKKYLLLNILGKGGFSEVFKAFDLESNCEVACKIHQLNNQWGEMRKKNYIKHALREYNIFKTIDHPSVVGLRGVFEIDQNGFCTVLEYCGDGDLDGKLKAQGRLSEREARCIITQVFTGLVHLNQLERPVIHYDLKPGNILFHRGQVKLTDFGLAKIMEEDAQDGMIELTSQGAGTYWYLPPECLQVSASPPKISSKVDVWSAGVILYQMLFGKKPFGHNISQKQILQDGIISTEVKVKFPATPKVSEEVKDFLILCLEPSQEKRPDVLAISKHAYLSAYKPKPLAK